MKPNIILRPEEFTSFTSYYLEDLWGRYFNISVRDPDKTYDRSNTLFAVRVRNADDEYSRHLRDQGYRVIVDNLWELPKNKNDYYWMENSNWFWYNESLWYRSLGYHQYTPGKHYSKLAFMPIRRHRHTRDYIVDKIGARLDNFVWSYQDKKLPNDIDPADNAYQRFLNPEWYDDTYFSVVVETFQEGKCEWVTEKIFKPCAYYHPFVVIGQAHTLARLRQLGFETYENLFDESYDNLLDFDQRLDAIISSIDNFNPQPYDLETQGRLQHNHDHFFDQALVESRIITEIVEPLINYAETR